MLRIRGLCLGFAVAAVTGCTTIPTTLRGQSESPATEKPATEKPKPTAMPPAANRVRPAYGELETLPIDLPTVIRLVDANSPAIGIAQARLRQAEARRALAEVQWLPNLSAGATYNHFDGQTQNQRGEVFGVSRGNLFASGGAALALDTAEAIYAPLVARRVQAAEQHRSQAVAHAAELEAVLAYLDLLQVHAQLAINADTLARAEGMLTAAQNAKDAKLDRMPGDVNRAQTEVLFRRVEKIELAGRVGTLSARLGRLLLLPASVRLVPCDLAVAPVPFIDFGATLDELVNRAIGHRPDLAADRELVAAAWARVRRQECGYLLPKLAVTNQTGGFGGGLNDDLQKFAARNAFSAQVYWEIKNLGFGTKNETRERQALLDQARLQQVEDQARVIAEIVEAAQLAAARYESLDLAERAVQEATELYRINKEGAFNVLDAKNLFDALRPLQAIQVLNQARNNYLAAVLDFNRAQYRLYAAVGQPPASAATLAAEVSAVLPPTKPVEAKP